MRTLLALLHKDVLHLLGNKPGLVLTFVVPMVLIAIFGSVFGLNRKDTGPTNLPLAVVNLSPEPAARDLVEALRKEKTFRVVTHRKLSDGTERPLTEADARAALAENEFRFALVLPADLLPSDAFGIRMRFLTNPRNDVETMTVTGMLQRAIFAHVPQLLGQSLQAAAKRHLGQQNFETFNRSMADAIAAHFGGDREAIYRDLVSGKLIPNAGSDGEPGSAAENSPHTPARDGNAAAKPASDKPAQASQGKAGGKDLFSRILSIETEQVVGRKVRNPMAARMIGGYGIMFLLFAISASATAFFEEKNHGLFQRVLAAPVARSQVIAAKFLYGLLLGFVQLHVLVLFGSLLYDIEVLPHLPALAVVALAAAASCSAFGMLIAAVSPNPPTANGLTTLLVLTMSAVGGAWFPVSFLPEFLQTAARFTLVYWSVEGITDVLFAGRGLLQILPTAGILAGIAALVMSVAVWRFNRGSLFD